MRSRFRRSYRKRTFKRKSYRRKSYRRKRFSGRRKWSKRFRGRRGKTARTMSFWVTGGPQNIIIPAPNATAYWLTTACLDSVKVLVDAYTPQAIARIRNIGEDWKITAMTVVYRTGLTEGGAPVRIVDSTAASRTTFPIKVMTDLPNYPILYYRTNGKATNSIEGITPSEIRNHVGIRWTHIKDGMFLKIKVPLYERKLTVGDNAAAIQVASSSKSSWTSTATGLGHPMLYGLETGIHNPGPDDWSTNFRITCQKFFRITVRRLKTGTMPSRWNTWDRNTTIALEETAQDAPVIGEVDDINDIPDP